ncbi:hypothetical protein D3C80_1091960 [compost metagenome]
MVDTWRWLKALLSSAVTMLMSTPRRLAASRSTTRVICWAPSPSLASMSVSSGRVFSASRTLGIQVRRSSSSLASSTYSYCELPPWWPPKRRSWSGIRNSWPPGTLGRLLRRRSATCWALTSRSATGFRRTIMKALLIPPSPPMKPATLSTAGSLSTARRKISIFGCMTWNDRPSSPRTMPTSWPVSCCGMKVFGTLTNSQTLRAMVASRLSRVSSECLSAHSRLAR